METIAPEENDDFLTRFLDGDGNLRAVFDNFHQGIIITDTRGLILYYNRAMGRIENFEPELAVGQNLLTLYVPNNIRYSATFICMRTGQPLLDHACAYKTPRGKKINAVSSYYPLFMDGQLKGSLGFTQRYTQLATPPTISTGDELPDLDYPVQLDNIIGHNPNLLKALASARAAAGSPSPILICGETGTGKEMFAKGIHSASNRRGKPLVNVNCAAIPGPLLESILFGTSKGAFTGALDQPGLFEKADGGILFLDEIDSMPLELQPKLLRVLQEMKSRRVGSGEERSLDFKLITAIGCSPREVMGRSKLRADLFYRIVVAIIHIPPLRERMDDLPLLVDHLLMKHNFNLGRRVLDLAPATWELFKAHHWPGNVRELEHVLEGAMNLMGNQELIAPDLLPDHFQPELINKDPELGQATVQTAVPPPSVPDESERQTIELALRRTFGNITMAAKQLGLSRQVLAYKMKRFNLQRESFRR